MSTGRGGSTTPSWPSTPVSSTVDRVATIVVFDGDGRVLGRVVETAEKPIEELLLEFIAPAEGW